MPKLALQAAVLHAGAGVVVERGGMERLRDLLELGRSERVAIRAQEALSPLYEVLGESALGLDGLPEPGRIAAALDQLGLGFLKGIARLEEGVKVTALRADDLIDRPRGERGLAELRDRGRLIALTVLAQPPSQRIALLGKTLERKTVEVAGLHLKDL